MLFLTFLFPYHVVNSQKLIIIMLTNAKAIHSHSPLLLPVKPNDVMANSMIPES